MICQAVAKLAILDVTMNVEQWDKLLEVGEVSNKIREMLLEVAREGGFGVDSQYHNSGECTLFLDVVTMPLLRQSQHSQTLDKKIQHVQRLTITMTYFSPFCKSTMLLMTLCRQEHATTPVISMLLNLVLFCELTMLRYVHVDF